MEDGAGELEQEFEYDGKGDVKYVRYEINGVSQSYSYEYENAIDDKRAKIRLPGGAEQTVGYDGLGRLTHLSLDGNFTKDVYYAKYGDHATDYVSSVWYGVNGKRDKNTRYTYDKKGNITGVKENGEEVVRYTYDSLNRIIREDNAAFKQQTGGLVITGKTETCEYDNNGNILVKTKYPYTLSGSLTGGVPEKYVYAQTGWKDRLLSSGGERTGDYDGIGNPAVYRGKAMRWTKGRQLASYNGEEYAYNASGIRTGKTAGEIETTYYLDGSKIIAEERRDASKGENNLIDALYYSYGIDGVTGFERKRDLDQPGETYVYGKNVQGDITQLYTLEGELVAEYVYDAWGNHSVSAAAGYGEIAGRNPMRYRGYYYDAATKLYYLNSHCYGL